jgi:teichuronic acid biosynthesis glycosyltransferase TuaG
MKADSFFEAALMGSTVPLVPGLVSIIMPAFKVERFISDAIRGVLSQSFGDWEMLIVNDCSPDDTARVMRDWASRDSRIRCLQTERNCGPAVARNIALQSARGQYIAFCDSDDIWLPEKLERQLSFMKYGDIAFSYTSFRRINSEGSRHGIERSVPPSLSYHQLMKNTAIVTSTVILDRFKVGPFQMPNVGAEDFALWLSILKVGQVAHGFPQALTLYRVRPESISANKFRSSQWVWSIYRNSEGLSRTRAAWYLLNYATRAALKRLRF